MTARISDDERTLAPAISDAERRGMRDYLEVYEANYDEIYAELIAALSDHPEIDRLLRSIPEDVRMERSRRSRALMRRAIFDDEWGPYLEFLRQQGGGYAQMGLSFPTWFAIVAALRPILYPYLVDAFGDDPDRLLESLAGSARLIEIVLWAFVEE